MESYNHYQKASSSFVLLMAFSHGSSTSLRMQPTYTMKRTGMWKFWMCIFVSGSGPASWREGRVLHGDLIWAFWLCPSQPERRGAWARGGERGGSRASLPSKRRSICGEGSETPPSPPSPPPDQPPSGREDNMPGKWRGDKKHGVNWRGQRVKHNTQNRWLEKLTWSKYWEQDIVNHRGRMDWQGGGSRKENNRFKGMLFSSALLGQQPAFNFFLL